MNNGSLKICLETPANVQRRQSGAGEVVLRIEIVLSTRKELKIGSHGVWFEPKIQWHVSCRWRYELKSVSEMLLMNRLDLGATGVPSGAHSPNPLALEGHAV